jgi:hypothetical protein
MRMGKLECKYCSEKNIQSGHIRVLEEYTTHNVIELICPNCGEPVAEAEIQQPFKFGQKPISLLAPQ